MIENLYEPILYTVLVSFRVAFYWILFPFALPVTIPSMVRVAATMIFAIALIPSAEGMLPSIQELEAWSYYDFAVFAFREVTIGFGLAIMIKWVLMAAIAAASWVGTQMGFSVGGLVNPEFQEADTSWANFHGWVALMVYISIGGHYISMKAFADSYRFDLSEALLNLTHTKHVTMYWIEIGNGFFIWMLKLAGPLVATTLLLQAAMGVLSKFIPQINIWTVSIPVTLAAGLLVFSLISPHYGDVLGKLVVDASETQYLFLRLLGAR